jgi:hypothetical protein
VYAKGHELVFHTISIEPASTTAFDAVLAPSTPLDPSVSPDTRRSVGTSPKAANRGRKTMDAQVPTDPSWLKYPLLAAGGALALAGGITYLVNTQRYDTLREQKRAWAAQVPVEPDPGWAAEAKRLDARQDQLKTADFVAIGLFGAGLATSAAGAAVWFASSGARERTTHPVAVKATFSQIEVVGRW